jgi:A/G-specific adenine glycosylase
LPGLSQGNPTAYPHSKPKKSIPARNGIMLIIRHGDQLLLEKRPPQGIWGGLYCFPQVESLTEVTGRLRELGLEDATYQGARWISSHFQSLPPRYSPFADRNGCSARPLLMEADTRLWYNLRHPAEVGLAAATARLLAYPDLQPDLQPQRST